MPKIASHHSAQIIKMLLLGESGSGKSGALASLAAAGYNLRIADMEDGLASLFNLLTDPKSPYPKDAHERVHFFTATDPQTNIGGTIRPLRSVAWAKLTNMLMNWKEPEAGVDFGPISKWTSQDILVIDTLKSAATAAYNFGLSLQGKLAAPLTQNEGRRAVYGAQNHIESLVQMLCDVNVKCNVIVTSHITYVDDENVGPTIEGEKKPQHGFPSVIGKAVSPKIPAYFNTVAMMGKLGGKQVLFPHSQGVINCKSPAPLRAKQSYPIGTALADYFRDLRGEATAGPPATPSAVLAASAVSGPGGTPAPSAADK